MANVDKAAVVARLRQIVAFSSARLSHVSDRECVEAASLVASCLGSDHYLVGKIESIPKANWSARAGTISSLVNGTPQERFQGYVSAAIAVIGVVEPVAPKPDVCDVELWEDIHGLIEAELWQKIPSAVVTFVEHWFRERGGDPRMKNGAKMIGADLMSRVMQDHPLGGQASEHQGWEALGRGLMLAVGNRTRHNVESRADAETFAWRVVGLGSLLLSELRRTHSHLPEQTEVAHTPR